MEPPTVKTLHVMLTWSNLSNVFTYPMRTLYLTFISNIMMNEDRLIDCRVYGLIVKHIYLLLQKLHNKLTNIHNSNLFK